MTINEPMKEVTRGYADGTFAPGIKQPGTAPYTVAHNLIRAHAKAYHVYKNEFKNIQEGKWSMTVGSLKAIAIDDANYINV